MAPKLCSHIYCVACELLCLLGLCQVRGLWTLVMYGMVSLSPLLKESCSQTAPPPPEIFLFRLI